MLSFVIVLRSAYFGTQKRRKYAKSVGVNRSDFVKEPTTLPLVFNLYLHSVAIGEFPNQFTTN